MTIREQINEARQQELLTVEQLALLTQYAEQTIYRKIRRNEIPGIVRYGRGIRIQRALAVPALAAQRAERSTGD